jgi:hypothetical protein
MSRSAPLTNLSGLSIDSLIRIAADQNLPPIDSWHPEGCGSSEMRILADGTWLHQGRAIARPELVRLFATLLRREPDGRVVLVTPAEKLEIMVDDMPFVAVEVASEGEGDARTLAFRLNSGEIVVAGPDRRIRIDMKSDHPRPLLDVRPGLAARIERSVYYELAEIALGEGADPPGLWSGGAFFAMMPQP